MEKNMFFGANNIIFENAKALRKNMTEAEKVLWYHLKQSPLGFKFRRQHPMGVFIADFYCHKAKLVIEIDGSVHNLEEVKENDINRQRLIEEWGLTVIRFTNKEVFGSTKSVMEKIHEQLQKFLK